MIPVAQDPEMAERHAAFFAEHAAQFPKLVAELERSHRGPAEAFDPLEFLPLDEQLRAIAAAGAVAVHVVPPYLNSHRAFESLVKAGRMDTLIDFANPTRWPQLYVLARRHDQQHLTEEGARQLSLTFAREFARRVRAGEIPEVTRP